MAVLNKHHGNIPADAIYIGRGSKWGNPYSHRQGTQAMYIVGSREEAVAAYEKELQKILHQEYEMGIEDTCHALAELHKKDLVCFCAPQACHGHVLERYAALCHYYLKGKTK